MNDEPTYEYVRGTGWVASYDHTETLSKVVGDYRITLIKRLPEIGEYGLSRVYYEDKTLDREFGGWLKGPQPGWYCNEANYLTVHQVPTQAHFWVTVTCDKIT